MLALCCHLNVFSATSLKVLLTLKKPKEQKESPFLVFHVAHMGINTKVRKYDMSAATYIRKIALKCLEFKGYSTPGFTDTSVSVLVSLVVHVRSNMLMM